MYSALEFTSSTFFVEIKEDLSKFNWDNKFTQADNELYYTHNIYVEYLFSSRLKDLLDETQISIQNLSNEIGVSSSIIHRWLRKNSSIKLENLTKVASFFNCSLDFICGNSIDYGSFYDKSKIAFFSNLKKIVIQKNKSILEIFRGIEVANKSYYRWQNGMLPKSQTLFLLAQYFNCSIDYLVFDI